MLFNILVFKSDEVLFISKIHFTRASVMGIDTGVMKFVVVSGAQSTVYTVLNNKKYKNVKYARI